MKISVIGAGAMGGSTVEGLLKTNVIMPADITVADPVQKTLDRFAEQGASVTTDNSIAAEGADVVMVVVKPWLVETVLNGIKDSLDLSKQLLVVIAARVSTAKIRSILAGSHPTRQQQSRQRPSPTSSTLWARQSSPMKITSQQALPSPLAASPTLCVTFAPQRKAALNWASRQTTRRTLCCKL